MRRSPPSISPTRNAVTRIPDKYWIHDPQGVAWETYHTMGEIQIYGAATQKKSEASACCTPAPAKIIGKNSRRREARPGGLSGSGRWAARGPTTCSSSARTIRRAASSPSAFSTRSSLRTRLKAIGGTAVTARRQPPSSWETALLLAVVVGSGIMGERLAGGQCRGRPPRKLDSDGRGAIRPDLPLRAGLRRALQPGRYRITARQRNARQGARRLLYRRPGARGRCRSRSGARDVRAESDQASQHARDTAGEFIGEIVATSGLLLAIRLPTRAPLPQAAATVALWITAAYWFTSSTSFANPAVTIARAMTDSFAGIAPASVAGFIAAQLLGAVLAHVTLRFLEPARAHPAE
jgi:hypothetical protein